MRPGDSAPRREAATGSGGAGAAPPSGPKARTIGEGGIRTPATVTRRPHFECGAISRSATSPAIFESAGRRVPVRPAGESVRGSTWRNGSGDSLGSGVYRLIPGPASRYITAAHGGRFVAPGPGRGCMRCPVGKAHMPESCTFLSGRRVRTSASARQCGAGWRRTGVTWVPTSARDRGSKARRLLRALLPLRAVRLRESRAIRREPARRRRRRGGRIPPGCAWAAR